MGCNRSYLKYLSILSLLLLGGCSLVADLRQPYSSEPQKSSQVSSLSEESAGASTPDSDNSVEADTASMATPTSDPGGEVNTTTSSDLTHGERLSTLDDGPPTGRLPLDIVPATGDAQRLSEIEPGRRDPFASLPARPFLVQQRPVASSSVSSPPVALPTAPTPTPSTTTEQSPVVPATPQAVEPIPLARQIPTPPVQRQPVPVAPVPTVPVAVPPAPIPVAPPIAPEAVSVASALPASPSFEFSGVVQMGDRVKIIVEEPSGSRYVQVGERVGNGQFVIKAVDFNQGSTPAVILERGGTESVHWVGRQYWQTARCHPGEGPALSR